jgi:hypothetical protein
VIERSRHAIEPVDHDHRGRAGIPPVDVVQPEPSDHDEAIHRHTDGGCRLAMRGYSTRRTEA